MERRVLISKTILYAICTHVKYGNVNKQIKKRINK